MEGRNTGRSTQRQRAWITQIEMFCFPTSLGGQTKTRLHSTMEYEIGNNQQGDKTRPWILDFDVEASSSVTRLPVQDEISSKKRVLVIAGSDSSGGAYGSRLYCFRLWSHSKLEERSRGRSESDRSTWMLCNDSDHGSDCAKHAGCIRYLSYTSCVRITSNRCLL